MIKKLLVALATAFIAYLAASCSAFALFPPEDTPQFNSEPIFPIEFERVMAGVFAVVFTIIFAAGALWLASQLWAYFQAGRHSCGADANDQEDATESPPQC